jgi:putative flippase GtrA
MPDRKFDGVTCNHVAHNGALPQLKCGDIARLPIASQLRITLSLVARYSVVGFINTVVSYAIILMGLRLGAGDYGANAVGYLVGIALSYILQRRWAFAVKTPPSIREAARFCAAAVLAYGTNLCVIHLARSMGYIGNPAAQAIAMIAYSFTFFVLSRYVVFARAV